MKSEIIQIIIVFCNIYYCYSKRYDNYTLYRGFPLSEDHLSFFKNLSDLYRVDFWRDPSLVNKPIEFIISPEHRNDFLENAEEHGIYLTTIMENVQRAFDEQTVKAYIRRNMASFDWRHYYRIDDINSWLQDLEKAHPEEVKISVIGKTHELRKILSIRVYLKNGPVHRPTVIIEGGIHAREWISQAVATYILNKIVTSSNNNSTNDQLKLIAKSYEWIFVPVVNPDGYEYSHTADRLWRKNRRERGVDINRNFGYKFGTVGVSSDSSSEIYAGETAFSEYESSALRDLIINKSKHLDYYLSLHSYGQYMIIPYAHTKAHVLNFLEVKKVAVKAAAELEKLYGTKYTVGTAYDTVGYLVSGASTCWVKNTYKVPYVMTIELRDAGNYGFALPPQLIIPTCKETLVGLMSLLTPKPHDHNKLSREDYPDYAVDADAFDNNMADAQDIKFLDFVVIICNVIFFIIVRFD